MKNAISMEELHFKEKRCFMKKLTSYEITSFLLNALKFVV